MIKSMTGFGAADGEVGGARVSVEIRSVTARLARHESEGTIYETRFGQYVDQIRRLQERFALDGAIDAATVLRLPHVVAAPSDETAGNADELVKIVDLRLRDLQGLLAARKITLDLTPKAKELIFTEGYDAAYGARPLKRAIQRLVQDPLAMKILDGEVLHGDTVRVDADKGGKLKFEAVRREVPEPVAAK